MRLENAGELNFTVKIELLVLQLVALKITVLHLFVVPHEVNSRFEEGLVLGVLSLTQVCYIVIYTREYGVGLNTYIYSIFKISLLKIKLAAIHLIFNTQAF